MKKRKMSVGDDKLAKNEAAIKRWRTRLKRAMSTLDKLEKQRKRLERASHADQIAGYHPDQSEAERIKRGALPKRPRGHALISDPKTLMPAIQEALRDHKAKTDLGIPSFLRREPDPVTEQIREEQAETKRLKARGRIEKLKAKKSGATKKMPLSGKAALDLIRNG